MPTASRPHILFVDDDPKTGELMQRFCADAKISCTIFQQPTSALSAFKETANFDLIVSDLQMPTMSGIELLAEIRTLDTNIPFIILTGYANVDNAIEALRLGASDFLKKPFDMDELLLLIDKTLEYRALEVENTLLKKQLKQVQSIEGLIGQSKSMHDIVTIIKKIADIRCHVIIEGESGTGKELAARAIHTESNFANTPYVVIDCGALTDTLLESELFGHEKGAFTGASNTKQGLLETAKNGTVFLDEIGNMSSAMQAKLLRVIQENQITRVGGLKPINIDVRFIVASNQNLDELVQTGQFRHDLYHRFNVIKFRMPGLRQRKDDIPGLLQYFIQLYASRYHRNVTGFNNSSMQQLIDYHWPGNVRELQNLVERHIALADQPLMQVQSLTTITTGNVLDNDFPELDELERRYILKVLAYFGNNKEQTAQTLGINSSTLWRKLKSYQ
ncbi:Response regulator of zinc sigma-54-dependent two-component system [hydrothermal vent metagenome]|uniref:Response regulator of zinc sigma-54-dependent two-component system n=1 Tax=hydrothermal vent metagenome TaxID=652676 RepID=A0A3B0ZTN5_9ZZZZ